MKAMNFYTANGWAGSNYDSKLSTKEIAAKEAEILNTHIGENGRLRSII